MKPINAVSPHEPMIDSRGTLTESSCGHTFLGDSAVATRLLVYFLNLRSLHIILIYIRPLVSSPYASSRALFPFPMHPLLYSHIYPITQTNLVEEDRWKGWHVCPNVINFSWEQNNIDRYHHLLIARPHAAPYPVKFNRYAQININSHGWLIWTGKWPLLNALFNRILCTLKFLLPDLHDSGICSTPNMGSCQKLLIS